MSNIQTSKKVSVGDMGLECPRCGAGLLHHYGISVFDRGEDAPDVVKTDVDLGVVKVAVVPDSSSGNPSLRRHGLVIRFTCEGCADTEDDVLELRLAQHKGSTEVEWRFKSLPKTRP